MYKSLTSIAKMFDVSVGYINKHFSKDLVEGKHFIYVGNMKRYNIEEMRKILVSKNEQTPSKFQNILDKFMI